MLSVGGEKWTEGRYLFPRCSFFSSWEAFWRAYLGRSKAFAPLGNQGWGKIHFFPLFCRRCEMFPCFLVPSPRSKRSKRKQALCRGGWWFGELWAEFHRVAKGRRFFPDNCKNSRASTSSPSRNPYWKAQRLLLYLRNVLIPFPPLFFILEDLRDPWRWTGLLWRKPLCHRGAVTLSGAAKLSGMCRHKLLEFATTSDGCSRHLFGHSSTVVINLQHGLPQE